MDAEEPIEVPLTAELDLHTFQPRELGSLLPEYFRACRRAGLLEVRVIHGKGTGALRSGVLALLERLPEVVSHRPGDETSGGWGAVRVRLRPWSVQEEPHGGESQVG